MPASMSLTSALVHFAAGAVSIVLFHQSAVALLQVLGLWANATPWSLEPPVPPFGVPSLVSKAFWGGLWAVVLGLVMRGRTGQAYWLGWVLLGATMLPLVAIFVVPAVKGLPSPDFFERFPRSSFVNAFWGLGTAALLRVFDRRTG
jgi:hypothetical protein